MFTPRCSPRAREFPRSAQLFCTTYGCGSTGRHTCPIFGFWPLSEVHALHLLVFFIFLYSKYLAVTVAGEVKYRVWKIYDFWPILAPILWRMQRTHVAWTWIGTIRWLDWVELGWVGLSAYYPQRRWKLWNLYILVLRASFISSSVRDWVVEWYVKSEWGIVLDWRQLCLLTWEFNWIVFCGFVSRISITQLYIHSAP